MKKNPLLFPLIMFALATLMYCIAFHDERDKNKILQEKIDTLIKNK